MLSKKQKADREGSYLNNYLRVMEGSNTFRSGFIAMYTKLGYPHNVDAPADLKKLFEKACHQERFPDFGCVDPYLDPDELHHMDEAELLKFRKQFTTLSNQDSSKTNLEMEVSCRTSYMMAMLDEELRTRHAARVPAKPTGAMDVFETPLRESISVPPKVVRKRHSVHEKSDDEV